MDEMQFFRKIQKNIMPDSEKGSNKDIKEKKQDLVLQLIKKFSSLFESLFKNDHIKNQLKFSTINEL